MGLLGLVRARAIISGLAAQCVAEKPFAPAKIDKPPLVIV
jgi:hypothetical protein